MTNTMLESPHLVHQTPGRIRVHLPGGPGQSTEHRQRQLREAPGILQVQANPLTGNLLIQFDPQVTGAARLLDLLGVAHRPANPPARPQAIVEGRGPMQRARIVVRGLDWDPDLSRRVAERLRQRPGVHQVRANPLTGRVRVDFDPQQVRLSDLQADVAELQAPPRPGEANPDHPLDPGPWVGSIVRTVGAALGFALLGFGFATGVMPLAEVAGVADVVESALSVFQGLPLTRFGARNWLGRSTADMWLSSASIAALTLSHNPVGLATSQTEAVRLLTQIRGQRAAWQQYEGQTDAAPGDEPGMTIRLQGGERTPRPAIVREGSGQAIQPTGRAQPVEPGKRVPAGAPLYGGPFVLALEAGRAFPPQPRPGRLHDPLLYERYLHWIGRAALGYGLLSGLLTGSVVAGLEALVVVNARPAMTGQENADASASARLIQAGVVDVSTRPSRAVRRPDVLLLDGARLLLGRRDPAQADSLAPGVPVLVAVCRRRGVELLLVTQHRSSAQKIAARSGIRLADERDALAAIHAQQVAGQNVALVSDSASAAPAFDACDLAIGLTSGRSRFPAPADLLAQDLSAVALLIEAGALRDRTIVDGTRLSIATNVFGAAWNLLGQGIDLPAQLMYVTGLVNIVLGWWRMQHLRLPGR